MPYQSLNVVRPFLENAGRKVALANGWNMRVALLGSRVNMKDAARYHAEKWRDAIVVLSLAAASAQPIPFVAVDTPRGAVQPNRSRRNHAMV